MSNFVAAATDPESDPRSVAILTAFHRCTVRREGRRMWSLDVAAIHSLAGALAEEVLRG